MSEEELRPAAVKAEDDDAAGFHDPTLVIVRPMTPPLLPADAHASPAASPAAVSIDSASGDLEPGDMVGGSGESSEGGGESSADIAHVTCGLLRAKLHLDKFMCPGIHQACIEYEGEFYTPKQFTIVAAKDKQKDWKGSIKMNRVPMRTLMERKQVDFYNHETYCSGKCASKNYRALFKESSEGSDFGSPAAAAEAPRPTTTDALPSSLGLGGVGNSFLKALSLLQRGGLSAPAFHPDFALSLLAQQARGADSLSSPKMQLLEAQLLDAQNRRQSGPPADPTHGLHTRPGEFWQGVNALGMVPELVDAMSIRVGELSILYLTRPELRPRISEKLSRLVGDLDMETEISSSLVSKRKAAQTESDSLNSEIEELRKRTEEQRRKQAEAKRKSQLFDQLLTAKLPRHD